MLDDLLMGARFLRDLPGFLRHPVTEEEARATLRRRLEHRERDFLALVKRAVYEHPPSPYRALLQLAGCEYGDLKRLVWQEGVEGALGELFRHGVYLAVDEFKGRLDVVRSSLTLPSSPLRMRNPLAAWHLPVQSGGSRSRGTELAWDLAFVRDRAPDGHLLFEALGRTQWQPAVWEVPGSGAMAHLLDLAAIGIPPVRWFTQLSLAAPGLRRRYRWSARALRQGSRLAGVPAPAPLHVPLDEPLPIAGWMAQVLRAGGTPHLLAFTTAAAQLCQAARDAGIPLAGAEFSLNGEPVTPARLGIIRAVGARGVPRYATVEAGLVGSGCLAPAAPDELHHLHDLVALIQPGPAASRPGLPADALLLSSLRATAPLILINVSMGDRARLVERACGCPLERLGWTRHLQNVRSDEKFTAGGMTFLGADVVHVLEHVLPERFGGGPTDYQLLEQDPEDGRARLSLLVHPRLGLLEAEAVVDAFLSGLGAGGGASQVMSLAWRASATIRLERRPPVATPTGKILHLHVNSTRAEAQPPLA